MADFFSAVLVLGVLAFVVLIDCLMLIELKRRWHDMWLEREAVSIERLRLERELAYLGASPWEEEGGDRCST